jgi:hypothetical protein
MTIHLNTVQIIGLAMLPGAFAVFYVLGGILTAAGLELTAVIAAAVTAVAVFIAGLVLVILGTGIAIGGGA